MGRIAPVGVLCACATFGGSDPRAAGSRGDQWEAVVAQPRWVVFDVARRVLADSGYVIAQSNIDLGIISTADRQTSTPPLGTMPVDDYPVRLSIVMTPLSRDSTRLSISGQHRSSNASGERMVDARSDEWRLVRGIGEAILAHLR